MFEIDSTHGNAYGYRFQGNEISGQNIMVLCAYSTVIRCIRLYRKYFNVQVMMRNHDKSWIYGTIDNKGIGLFEITMLAGIVQD
ncbi:MAG: hypothetical protein WKF36_06775 [Candidatus Nitrosocosmicus sp.]